MRYELIKGHGELFKVHRESGDIEIKQSLEGHNREYDLLIAAYDKGKNQNYGMGPSEHLSAGPVCLFGIFPFLVLLCIYCTTPSTLPHSSSL